jgi:glutaredoxin 3
MNSAVSKKGAGAFDAPDGYTFRAFDGARAEEPTDFLLVSIHVSDLTKARSFYVDTLGGTVYEGATGAGETGGAASLVLGWGGVGAAKLELVELPGGQAVDHKLGGGRLAMETEDGAPTSMAGKVAAAGREVRHGPIKLAPHNEEVAIVVDDDGHEYCYVDARGYTNCIDVRGKAGGDEVSWAYRDLLEECSARGGATPAEKVTLAKLMAGDYDKAEARARLDALTAGPCVVVSQSGCPFCAKAKAALADLGAAYTEVNLDEQADGKALRAELCDLTGRSSVPNIFLAGASIGGYSDGLEPLLESGGAAGKLKAAGAL